MKSPSENADCVVTLLSLDFNSMSVFGLRCIVLLPICTWGLCLQHYEMFLIGFGGLFVPTACNISAAQVAPLL